MAPIECKEECRMCSKCKANGHYRRDCPNLYHKVSEEKNDRNNPLTTFQKIKENVEKYAAASQNSVSSDSEEDMMITLSEYNESENNEENAEPTENLQSQQDNNVSNKENTEKAEFVKRLEKLEKMNKKLKRKNKTLELQLQIQVIQNSLQNIQTQLLKKEVIDCENMKHLSSFKQKYAETLITPT